MEWDVLQKPRGLDAQLQKDKNSGLYLKIDPGIITNQQVYDFIASRLTDSEDLLAGMYQVVAQNKPLAEKNYFNLFEDGEFDERAGFLTLGFFKPQEKFVRTVTRKDPEFQADYAISNGYSETSQGGYLNVGSKTLTERKKEHIAQSILERLV